MVEYVRVESRANCLMALKRSGGACVSLAKVELGNGDAMTGGEWYALAGKCIPYLVKGDLAKYKEMCKKHQESSGKIGDPNASCMLSCYAIKDIEDKGKDIKSVYRSYQKTTVQKKEEGNYMFFFDAPDRVGMHSTETETRSEIKESLVPGWILCDEVKKVWVYEKSKISWIDVGDVKKWLMVQRKAAGVNENGPNIDSHGNLRYVK